MSTRLATRYKCPNDGREAAGLHHTRGNGKPARKACQWCKGTIYTETGLWGAFHWTGNGRYPEESALRTWTSEAKADAYAADLYAADDRSDVVIRWIPKDPGS